MSDASSEVTVAANTQDVLGEVPVWDADAGCLWWTDVFRPAIHRLDEGFNQSDLLGLCQERTLTSVAQTYEALPPFEIDKPLC